jgi:hypothetical protein
LPRLLPAQIVRHIDQLVPERPTVFNRITLLFVIKEAILFAALGGNLVATQDDVERVGVCFLMANDLMLGAIPQSGDSFLQKIAGLLPFGDLLPRETPMEDIVRNQLLLSEILERPAIKNHTLHVDLSTMFKEKCGISYERFVALVFGATTRYTLPMSEEALVGAHPYLPASFYNSTNATSSEVASFFRLTAATLEGLKARLQGTTRPTDFSPLQAYPLLRHADGACLCLDPAFLQDKAGKGLFWTLRAALTASEGEKLKNLWGLLSEEYLHWLWETSYLGSGQYLRDPKFADGMPAFDACLTEGSTLTVFEYKSSSLTASAKHSFDEQALAEDLHKKYAVFGSKPKGIGQLERGLQRLCDGEVIPGLEFSAVRKIFSVIVSLDEALVGLGLARYLDGLLLPYRRAMSKRSRKVFPPLFSVLVSDIEYVLPYTDNLPFWEMLERFAKAEPSRSGPLRLGITKSFASRTAGRDIIRERFDRVEKDFLRLFSNG